MPDPQPTIIRNTAIWWRNAHLPDETPSVTDDQFSYVWQTWNSSASTMATTAQITASATTDNHWLRWNGDWASQSSAYLADIEAELVREFNTRNAYTPPAPTPEQLEAQRVATAARDARIEAERTIRLAAIDKANALLDSLLNIEQRQQLKDRDHFDVIAQLSQRRYQIHRGTHGNIHLLDAQGHRVATYCAQPGDVPLGDSMLAQKLMIEHDEAAFLKVANPTINQRSAVSAEEYARIRNRRMT